MPVILAVEFPVPVIRNEYRNSLGFLYYRRASLVGAVILRHCLDVAFEISQLSWDSPGFDEISAKRKLSSTQYFPLVLNLEMSIVIDDTPSFEESVLTNVKSVMRSWSTKILQTANKVGDESWTFPPLALIVKFVGNYPSFVASNVRVLHFFEFAGFRHVGCEIYAVFFTVYSVIGQSVSSVVNSSTVYSCLPDSK